MSMLEKDFLKLIDDFEKQIPEPSEPDIEHTRYLAEWASLMSFLIQSLGKIDEIVRNEFKKKFGELLGGREEKRQYEWECMQRNFKNGFVLLRDWVKRKFKYASHVQTSSAKPNKEWLYWTNGKAAYLQITGKVFPLNDTSQQRGKNASVHLMDLLSFPGRVALVTEEDFRKRITEAGEQYSSSKKSSTFKEAIRRINNLVGRTPDGKEFLLVTMHGCKINEIFVTEFDPNPAQV